MMKGGAARRVAARLAFARLARVLRAVSPQGRSDIRGGGAQDRGGEADAPRGGRWSEAGVGLTRARLDRPSPSGSESVARQPGVPPA
jgi:hypothetical protein